MPFAANVDNVSWSVGGALVPRADETSTKMFDIYDGRRYEY